MLERALLERSGIEDQMPERRNFGRDQVVEFFHMITLSPGEMMFTKTARAQM